MAEASTVTRHSAVIGATSPSRDLSWTGLAASNDDALATATSYGVRRKAILDSLREQIQLKTARCEHAYSKLRPRRLAFLELVYSPGSTWSLAFMASPGGTAKLSQAANKVLAREPFAVELMRLLMELLKPGKELVALLVLVISLMNQFIEALGWDVVEHAYAKMNEHLGAA
ncbi:Arylsulphatase [Pseudohyphozyma bogoriensis]|nr:Arylsulphatase [Pseudohyphozyma bogoriensis]